MPQPRPVERTSVAQARGSPLRDELHQLGEARLDVFGEALHALLHLGLIAALRADHALD